VSVRFMANGTAMSATLRMQLRQDVLMYPEPRRARGEARLGSVKSSERDQGDSSDITMRRKT